MKASNAMSYSESRVTKSSRGRPPFAQRQQLTLQRGALLERGPSACLTRPLAPSGPPLGKTSCHPVTRDRSISRTCLGGSVQSRHVASHTHAVATATREPRREVLTQGRNATTDQAQVPLKDRRGSIALPRHRVPCILCVWSFCCPSSESLRVPDLTYDCLAAEQPRQAMRQRPSPVSFSLDVRCPAQTILKKTCLLAQGATSASSYNFLWEGRSPKRKRDFPNDCLNAD